MKGVAQTSSPWLAKTGKMPVFLPQSLSNNPDFRLDPPGQLSNPVFHTRNPPHGDRIEPFLLFTATSHGVEGDELLLEVAMATPVMIPPAARAGRIQGPMPPPNCARTT